MKLRVIGIVSLILILAACSGQAASSKENQLDALIEDYPAVQTELKKLSEGFKGEITVPDMERIPLSVNSVEAAANIKFEPNGFDVYYAEDEKRLNVMVQNQKGMKATLEETNQELDHEINGMYSEAEDGHMLTLMWISQNENTLYRLVGLTPSGKEAAFTKEDMVEIANSIIQQRE